MDATPIEALTGPIQPLLDASLVTAADLRSDPGVAGAAILELFLASYHRRPTTQRTYLAHLRRLARHVRVPVVQLPALLLGHGPHRTQAILRDYEGALATKSLSTRATAIATVRALVAWARRQRLITWAIDLKAPRVRPLKDTSGPGPEGVRALLAAAAVRPPAIAARDRFVLLALYTRGLRREELVSCDLAHVLWEGARPVGLMIMGKGQDDREPVALPQIAQEALVAWLEHRGAAPGPLVTSLAHRHRSAPFRLCGRGVARILAERAADAGLERANPHSLRHSAVTAALDAGAEIGEAAAFARHDVRMTRIYDDNRQQRALRVAERVAGTL